jgi:hypothetical protein
MPRNWGGLLSFLEEELDESCMALVNLLRQFGKGIHNFVYCPFRFARGSVIWCSEVS